MAIDYDDPAVIQEAKDKLAEMYSKAARSGRVAIGRGLGYAKAGTNPDSARRSAERLATFRIGKGSKLDVTKYFRDIVYADEDVPPWDGNLPVLTAERGETYYITAYAGFQRGEGGAFDGFITPNFHATHNNIRSLFEGVNQVVRAIFRNDPQDARFPGTNRNDYLGIIAMALSEVGIREMEPDTGPLTKRETVFSE